MQDDESTEYALTAGRRRAVAAAVVVAVIGAAAALAALYVYLVSETIIERRYPLASTTAHAEATEKAVRRGAHLVTVAGCADCHGANLHGRLLHAGISRPVWSGNLLRDAQTMSDDELERAIRGAIRPDATSMWVMPSANYVYMSEDDVASTISYLRSRNADGPVRPAPSFDFGARIALVDGRLRPMIPQVADSPSSLDMGPRYDGGRYLARLACGECHGTDLKGIGYAPDLSRISLYNRAAFFALMRQGYGANGRALPAMYRLARIRFHVFADYEIMALYDYLDARAHAPPALVARAEALRRHQEDARKRLEREQ